METERGVPTPLTFEAGYNGTPIWSPDGDRVAFSSGGRDDSQSIYQRRADGSGSVERLLDKEHRQFPASWPRDELHTR